MNKYVDNEINEGAFVILQTLEALMGKYHNTISSSIEKKIKLLMQDLINETRFKDNYTNVDFEDTKFIQRLIYKEDQIDL